MTRKSRSSSINNHLPSQSPKKVSVQNSFNIKILSVITSKQNILYISKLRWGESNYPYYFLLKSALGGPILLLTHAEEKGKDESFNLMIWWFTFQIVLGFLILFLWSQTDFLFATFRTRFIFSQPFIMSKCLTVFIFFPLCIYYPKKFLPIYHTHRGPFFTPEGVLLSYVWMCVYVI